MKKIIALSIILITLSAAASAQRPREAFSNIRTNDKQLTWGEKKELRKDAVRYHLMKRRATRDGIVTPIERRKLRRAKCDSRRDAFRFRHNGRRRLI